MRKTNKIILTLLISSTHLVSGCAYLDHGSTQIVSVNSMPEGARVQVKPGKEEVITPAKIILKRKSSYIVRIEKDGYRPENISLESSESSSLWHNVAWILPAGMIAGVVVDLTTGARNSLNPKDINVKLTPINLPPTVSNGSSAD